MPHVLETPIITDPLRVHQGVAWSVELDLADDAGEPLPDTFSFTGYLQPNQHGSEPVAFDMEYAEGVLVISLEAGAVNDHGSYEWRITEDGQEPQVFGKGEVLFSKSVFPVAP